MGLTLDELAGLARAKTRRRVTVLRDMSAEEFREHLKRSNDPAHRYIINFDRKAIFIRRRRGYQERPGFAQAFDKRRQEPCITAGCAG